MEFDLIDIIRSCSASSRRDVLLGIGDDAALVQPPVGQQLAIAVDTLVEGVHFPAATAASDLGWKSLAVNLSDLAAMAATPAWALLSLTLPTGERGFVEKFVDGFMQLARAHGVALVGGDTTQGPLSVTVTVHGFVPPGQALRRDGAKAGDVVLVTGTLGDAAAALRCLDRRDARADALVSAPRDTRESLLARLNRPTPRVAAGAALRGRANACIDVSDGLLADLGHICAASAVGAEIDAASLPQSSALLTLFDENEAMQFALSGGDDYELCFSVPPEHAAAVASDLSRMGCGATRIGRVVAGNDVAVRGVDGNVLKTLERGWTHFDT